MLSNLFRNIPPITLNLLIINVLMFFGVSVLPQFGEILSLHYFESSLFYPHQIITHIFMHGDITHLFFNMFMLVMVGSHLERVWNGKKYLIIYFVSAIGAVMLQYVSNWYQLKDVSPEVWEIINTQGVELMTGFPKQNFSNPILGNPNAALNNGMVGASGAIMGLMASFAYLFPNTEFNIYFVLPVKAKYFIPVLIFIDLYLGTRNFEYDNVAHWAHIGGAIAGLFTTIIWNKNRSNFY